MLKNLINISYYFIYNNFFRFLTLSKRNAKQEDQTKIIDENISSEPYQNPDDSQEQADLLNAEQQQRVERS